MDIQLALLSSLMKEGVPALKYIQKGGLDNTSFSGDARTVYKFIEEYYNEYKKLPSTDAITGKTGCLLYDTEDSCEFFFKEFKAAKLHNYWQECLEKILTSQESRNPYRTQELIEDSLMKVKELQLAPSAVEEMYELGIEAYNLYEALERGETGILTPWTSLNKISSGFWPQDLIIFAARSGAGKTWSMLLLAQYAYEVQKKKILFISPEMPKERLSLRFNAIKYKLPYDSVLQGTLDKWQKKRFWEGVQETRSNIGFGVVSSKNFDYSMSSLSSATSYSLPGSVSIDGVYLLKAHGVNRNEQAANLMNDIKRLAIKFGIPIVISTQFNKTVSSDKASSVKDTGIAMTDVANWNNSLAIGLLRDTDMELQKTLELKLLKVREGKKQDSIKIWWDFDDMRFSEISPDDLLLQESGSTVDPNDPFANVLPSVRPTDLLNSVRGAESAATSSEADDYPF